MSISRLSSRLYATSASTHHKVVVVGAGSAGLGVANQLYNSFSYDGRSLAPGDIALVDGSKVHNYQPGWTLVGAGLKTREQLQRQTKDLIPSHLTLHDSNASTFSPDTNSLTLNNGQTVSYDFLVVATGLQTNWSAIGGLEEALKDSTKTKVSSIYSYDTVPAVWENIQSAQSGSKAIFTQPKGIIKCAGAPQKIMWMANDKWNNKDGKNISVEFVSGMPAIFAVPKYAQALSALADKRGVTKTLNTNLVSVDSANRKATFKTEEGETVTKDYDFLHAVPPQGPLDVIKKSPLADAAGWVDVSPSTLQSTKYANIFSLGDASSLPTSKTAAAITAETPVLVHNLKTLMETGTVGGAVYDGYTSCPLLTGYGELMLAEFKYGAQPKETFAAYGIDQAVPNRAFYHLKKDIFPWAYYQYMTKGEWFGSKGLSKPKY